MKNKGSECERLRQAYPVNWWLWLNLSSGLLKPNPILVQPHQSFKIYGSQTTCIKIAGLYFKWPSLTRRHRHLVTVPAYPYTRAQDTWMSIRWHTDVTMVMAFFTTPGDGLGGNASHLQSTPHGSVFIQPGSPVLSSRMFMCPPIVVSIVSMWRSQNCSMRKNIFVVILSLPIISLKKTFLSPDIQTGWFMQSG